MSEDSNDGDDAEAPVDPDVESDTEATASSDPDGAASPDAEGGTTAVDLRGGAEVTDEPASDEGGALVGSAGARRSTWLVLGVWAVIGVGMGLAPVAIGLVAPNASVGTWSNSLGLLTSAGPIVGGVIGLVLAVAVPLEPVRGAVVSLGANGVGFALFVVVFIAILVLAAGASVAVSVEALLTATLVAAVPVAITAGAATGIALALLEPADSVADRR